MLLWQPVQLHRLDEQGKNDQNEKNDKRNHPPDGDRNDPGRKYSLAHRLCIHRVIT